uniref:Small ribosomal subunit protein uS2c n=1 Tax=Johansenicoccus eremophilus TaxID=3068301 RepID=A0AA49LNH2_9CHLO|nr:ribosomal protein S2 [Chlorophyceae sp. KF-2023a]
MKTNNRRNTSLQNSRRRESDGKKTGGSFNQSKNLAQSSGTRVGSEFKIGLVMDFKITAIGSKNLGLAELENGYTVVIPRTRLGDIVKAEIVKVNNTKLKYALARKTESIKSSNQTKDNLSRSHQAPPVRVDAVIETVITKQGPCDTGLVFLSKNYKIVVPNALIGQKQKIQITRVKANYAFAKVISVINNENEGVALLKAADERFRINGRVVQVGSLLTFKMPSKQIKIKDNFVLKVGHFIFFIKQTEALKAGERVRIQLSKILTAPHNNSKENNVSSEQKKEPILAVAKVVQILPLTHKEKTRRLKNKLSAMLENGVHFGERVVRCHAKMKPFIWGRKKSKDKKAGTQAKANGTNLANSKDNNLTYNNMLSKVPANPLETSYSQKANSLERSLMEHRKRANVFEKSHHVIDLLKTQRLLSQTLKHVARYAAKGQTFLFIGSKKSAASLISKAALFARTAFFVNTRWLGGMLTNWQTCFRSIAKLRPILILKQKIISSIIEKRQKVQASLIRKVLNLKLHSRELIKKGKHLVLKLKSNSTLAGSIDNSKENNIGVFLTQMQRISEKKTRLINHIQNLVKEQTELMRKHFDIMDEALVLQSNLEPLVLRKKALIQQVSLAQKRILELQLLLSISQEIQNKQQRAQKAGVSLYSISYSTVNDCSADTKANQWLLPNPPKHILTQIINAMQKQYDMSNPMTVNGQTPVALKADTSKAGGALVFSKLLLKFGLFAPVLLTAIEETRSQIDSIYAAISMINKEIDSLRSSNSDLKEKQNLIKTEIEIISTKLKTDRRIARKIRRKVRRLFAEQRLLRFLPRLRYFPTQTDKLYETARVLMKKVVDPKLKYPIDRIYDKNLRGLPKKLASAYKKKWHRLEKYFGGVSGMSKTKNLNLSNTVAIIIGQREEMNAVLECKKLGMKTIHIVDTNCDPGLADHFIPANDDSRDSVKFILEQILMHIRMAQKIRKNFVSRSYAVKGPRSV